MPWQIRKRKDKYCVCKAGEDTPIPGGCHDTRLEAEDQLAALYANATKHLNSEDLIALGEQVKAVELSADGRYAKVGAYGLRFGQGDERDLTDDWFGSDTDFGPHGGNGMAATFHHCQPVGKEPAMKALSQRIFRPVKAVKDEIGIFVEHVLDMADEYEKAVYSLVKAGKLRWSSGTASHLVLRDQESGQVKRWHVLEWAYTPEAAEPRLPKIAPIKAIPVNSTEIMQFVPELKAIEQPMNSGAGAEGGEIEPNPTQLTEATMNLIEKIKVLVPGLTEEQYAQLAAVLELAYSEGAPEEPVEIPEAESEPALEMADDKACAPKDDEEDPMRSVDIRKLVDALKAQAAPAARKSAAVRPQYPFKAAKADEEDTATKSFNALYQMRFGSEDDGIKAVMTDLVGKNYRQTIFDQNRSFGKYLRHGDGDLDRDERGLLRRQIFPVKAIQQMLEDGMDVSAIKSTMVEAQGSLGGYAVPPNVQQEISARLPGMTAVRGLGARVVTLTNSNAIEIPRYTGGDTQYVGALRGLWGGETQSPTEDNATLDMVSVTANVYTYKVPMSQSLVEDAANLVQLVQSDIANTLAIDEDNAFLVGDGAGKPRGVLPSAANSDSITEVVTADADELTADGLIGLSDALADQYLDGAAFVFERATHTAIRKLKTGAGEYLFDRTGPNGMMGGWRNANTLLGFPYRRQDGMPTIGANTYPIIFANFAGYTIVERAGLTIARFQDSNTGINKVEFHVRRRVGGRVEKPWMFAVQKVAAS